MIINTIHNILYTMVLVLCPQVFKPVLYGQKPILNSHDMSYSSLAIIQNMGHWESFDYQMLDADYRSNSPLARIWETVMVPADDKVLYNLLKSEHPSLTPYAILTLLLRENIQKADISEMCDTLHFEVHVKKGCITATLPMNIFCRDIMTTLQTEKQIFIPLFGKEVRKVITDSTMEKYLEIRKKVINMQDPLSYAELATFKNKNDIPLILHLLTQDGLKYPGLRCVMLFPDPAFLPFLSALHQKMFNGGGIIDPPSMRVFYKALVQYKNEDSLHLLQKSLQNCPPHMVDLHKKTIALALTLYPDPMYNSIAEQIEEKYFQSFDEFNFHDELELIRE